MISIIIPTLNEAATIQALLGSLQTERQQGHEVIVVDGGSHDPTLALAEGLADVILVSAQSRALQMNRGAQQAQGDILWFLHADSAIPAQATHSIVQALSHHPQRWGRFQVQLSGTDWRFKMIAWFMNQRSRLTGICTGDQGIFVTRTLFETCQGFPNIALMEDIALSQCLLKHAGKPQTLPLRLLTSSRRWQQHGIWSTIFLMWRLRWAYFRGQDPAQLKRWYP